MKLVLLLVFLALGPAIGNQTPLVPSAVEAAYLPTTVPGSMRPADPVSRRALTDDEIARYCGGRS